MLTINEVKNTIWDEFSYLTDKEIMEIRDNMYTFWDIFLDDN